jgi:hypothetical protein
MTAQQPFHYFFGRPRGLPVSLGGLVAFANHRQLLGRDRRVVSRPRRGGSGRGGFTSHGEIRARL